MMIMVMIMAQLPRIMMAQHNAEDEDGNNNLVACFDKGDVAEM